MAEHGIRASAEGGFLRGLFEKGFRAIFGGGGAILAAAVLAALVLAAVWLFASRRKGDRRAPALGWDQAAGYLLIALSALVTVFLYAAPFMGLPEFISVERVFCVLRALVYAVPWILLDYPLSRAASGRHGAAVRRAAVLVCAAVYCFSYVTDFHEFPFWMLKRHQAAVRVTAEITERFQPGSYAVISMDDEWPQVEGEGSCVQLLDFIGAVEKEDAYSLPEEYLFLYVEKHPIKPGTNQYFTGPAWLGRASSECRDALWDRYYPEVVMGSISRRAAEFSGLDYEGMRESYFDAYFNMQIRTVLCSKAYYWYQDFVEVYPTESNVYYEDEDFICYVIHQDPEAPLNLAIRG